MLLRWGRRWMLLSGSVIASRNRFNRVPRGEDFGIIAEPYFDVDFDEVFYLTDTGRSWNNAKASIRDKVCNEKIRKLEGEKVSKSKAGMKDKVLKKEDEKIKEQDVRELEKKKVRTLERRKVSFGG